jgi:hypothetical protein
MLRNILIASLALFLASCGGAGQSGSPSPASSVFAAKTAYVGALGLAVKYNALPRCGAPTSPPICSDASVVLQLRKADQAAGAALDGAETIVRTPGVKDSVAIAAARSATEAVKLLQTVLVTYQVK